MDWKMFDTADCDRIHGMHGDSVIVHPSELIGLAEYLESITSTVYWEGRAICGAENDISKRLREIACQSRPC